MAQSASHSRMMISETGSCLRRGGSLRLTPDAVVHMLCTCVCLYAYTHTPYRLTNKPYTDSYNIQKDIKTNTHYTHTQRHTQKDINTNTLHTDSQQRKKMYDYRLLASTCTLMHVHN